MYSKLLKNNTKNEKFLEGDKKISPEMQPQEFSFAVDRRSVQTTFYHFSERTSGEADKRGFSQQDSLTWALGKIYQSKFANISEQLRNTLVDILVTEAPLAHNNLTMLAAANFIVYHMRSNRISMDTNPSSFGSQCDENTSTCASTDQSVISCKQNANTQISSGNKNTFEAYFNFVAPFIVSDLTQLKPEDVAMARTLYKITLLRYIIFVQNNTTNYMAAYTGQGVSQG